MRKVAEDKICDHCRGLIEIRMPVPESGCDHLYYPENCDICKLNHPTDYNLLHEKLQRRTELARELLDHLKNADTFPEPTELLQRAEKELGD